MQQCVGQEQRLGEHATCTCMHHARPLALARASQSTEGGQGWTVDKGVESLHIGGGGYEATCRGTL